MATYERKLDDDRPAVTDTLERPDGSTPDLANASEVYLLLEEYSTGTLVINAQASITDAQAGDVKYELADGDLNREGFHVGEWRVTYSDGDDEWFPKEGNIAVDVNAGVNRTGTVDPGEAARGGPLDALDFNGLSSAPSDPAAGDFALWVDDSGGSPVLTILHADGTLTTVGSGGGTDVAIEDDGTQIVSATDTIDFAGSDFDVTNPTGDDVQIVLTDDSLTVAGNTVSLGGSTAIAHADLSSIGADDHHAQDQSANYKDGGSFEIDAAEFAAALGTAGQVLQSDGAAASWATLASGDISDFDEAAQDAVGTITSGGDKISVTYDDANDTITIDTTALDEEEVEDAVNTLLSAGNAVTLTYDDANDALTVAVDNTALASSGLEGDGGGGIRLASAGAGDGLKGGSGSAYAVEPADFAGAGLADDGSDNLTPDTSDEGTITASGGATPAADTTVATSLGQTDAYDVLLYVDADPAFDADYQFNYDYAHRWDDSTSTVKIDFTVTWDTDPGAGNDVTLRWEVIRR